VTRRGRRPENVHFKGIPLRTCTRVRPPHRTSTANCRAGIRWVPSRGVMICTAGTPSCLAIRGASQFANCTVASCHLQPGGENSSSLKARESRAHLLCAEPVVLASSPQQDHDAFPRDHRRARTPHTHAHTLHEPFFFLVKLPILGSPDRRHTATRGGSVQAAQDQGAHLRRTGSWTFRRTRARHARARVLPALRGFLPRSTELLGSGRVVRTAEGEEAVGLRTLCRATMQTGCSPRPPGSCRTLRTTVE
jgi:hypothetical protein